MAKYEQYAEYKDSGVEWLGEIPNHWEVVPIKHLAILNPKKSTLSQDLMSDECSFVPMEKLKFNSLVLDEKKVIKDVYDGYTYFENGDILVAKVTPCFENNNTTIANDLINGVGFGSSEIFVLRVNDKVNNRYLFYRLLETIFISVATAAMTGAGGLRRVPAETINTYPIAVPDINEQTQIANFLDHETAHIDTLIEKQQTLIQLLKEKRQAVISHAVTKGLNPDAPMKDSGVEWLGSVPEHWEVKRIKHYGKIMGGFAFKSDDFIDSGYPVLKISNVSHIQLNFDDESFLPLSFVEKHLEYKVEENDLVFAMTRPIISGGIKVAKIPKLEAMPLVNQRVGFLKLKSELLADFILYSSLSSSFKAQFKNNMTITNQPNISGEGIESVALPMPPKNELVEIVDFLNNSETVFQNLSIKSEQQVELLKERRTALISAAVTGKIDVRGWRAADNKTS